jgi:adenylate cyclase
MSPGSEKLLRDEAWRNERVINVYRSVLWTLVSVLIFLSPVTVTLKWLILLGVAYGVGCAVLGVTWLRRHYHDWVPYVMTTLDLALLSLIAGLSYVFLVAVGDPIASWQLYTAHGAYMLLLCTNILRFSWRVTIYTTAAAAVGYSLVLLSQKELLVSMMVVNVLEILGLGALLAYSARKLRVLIQRMKERDTLSRYLPAPLVEAVSRDPGAMKMGGQKQYATVMFSDIRGFTAMSEAMDPTEVVTLLNEYLEEMVAELDAWDGVLDKFIGDGICAVFGPPLSEHDGAERAIRCAHGMLVRLDALNERRRQRSEPELRIGIGVHSGDVVAGEIGSRSRRMEYTHIGDAMNTASRVESMTKEMGVSVLVSEETSQQAGLMDLKLKPMGEMVLRGHTKPTLLFTFAD